MGVSRPFYITLVLNYNILFVYDKIVVNFVSRLMQSGQLVCRLRDFYRLIFTILFQSMIHLLESIIWIVRFTKLKLNAIWKCYLSAIWFELLNRMRLNLLLKITLQFSNPFLSNLFYFRMKLWNLSFKFCYRVIKYIDTFWFHFWITLVNYWLRACLLLILNINRAFLSIIRNVRWARLLHKVL